MHSLFRKLNFTKNEIKVLLFLFVILFLGLGLKVSKEYFSEESKFDYQKAGKLFYQKSGGLPYSVNDSNIVNDSVSGSNIKTDIGKTNLSEDSLKSLDTKKKKKGKKGENLQEKSINLNTASREQLILLPGVGESTADKIIQYRKDYGSFKKIEDIMKIKGIGNKKFEKMKNFIIVD